jgi:hypothetical protein
MARLSHQTNSGVMVVTVMDSAQRYGELVADLEPHRAGLVCTGFVKRVLLPSTTRATLFQFAPEHCQTDCPCGSS